MMTRRAIGWALLACVLVSLVFFAFPGLDLWASSWVYEPGRGFVRMPAAVERLRTLGQLVVVLVPVTIGLAVLLKLLVPARRLLVDARASLFLLTTLLVGPALLVNVVLKDNWGRPRPREVTQFGGAAEMMPAWVPGGACGDNCSFVSGETASAFWTLALAAVAPPALRTAAFAAALVYGSTVGAIRFAAGGHFLSDVLLAALLTHLVVALTYDLMIRRDPPWTRPDRLEGRLARAGARLGAERRRLVAAIRDRNLASEKSIGR
jgi:membrane-associated PAP2 superfamily phosphatase